MHGYLLVVLIQQFGKSNPAVETTFLWFVSQPLRPVVMIIAFTDSDAIELIGIMNIVFAQQAQVEEIGINFLSTPLNKLNCQ